MAIIDPSLENEVMDKAVDKIVTLVQKQGGKVNKADRWGRKKLAYEIKHKGEGYYVLVDFNAQPDWIEEINRVLGISDEVMRARVVRVPQKKQ